MGKRGPKPGTPSPLKGRCGYKRPARSQQWCENISKAHGGKWIAPGIKKKIALICKNCTHVFYVNDKSCTPTYCCKKCFKQSCTKRQPWNKNKHPGPREAQKKANEARVGLPRPDIAKALTGRQLSDDHRKSISLGNTGRVCKDETRKKISDKLIGHRVHTSKKKFVYELGHIVRSKLESKVCFILKENSIKYEYEPCYIKLASKIVHGTWIDIHLANMNIWIECKGPNKFKQELTHNVVNSGCFIDDRSIEKMKQFRLQYPQYKLWVVTYKSTILNIPKECYDRIFIVEDLKKLIEEITCQKV